MYNLDIQDKNIARHQVSMCYDRSDRGLFMM
jgi:hypothetical protein